MYCCFGLIICCVLVVELVVSLFGFVVWLLIVWVVYAWVLGFGGCC